MTYRFLGAARHEFDAAIDWYDARSATAAANLIAEVYAVVRTICEMPESGERWENHKNVRTIALAPDWQLFPSTLDRMAEVRYDRGP